MWVVRDLIKNEGFAGFFKGVIPKTLCVSLPSLRLLTPPSYGSL